jgi:5-methylcytosine-specific restriction endonuclease McrA
MWGGGRGSGSLESHKLMLKYRKCKIEGCNNLGRNRGLTKRGTLCEKHHYLKYPNKIKGNTHKRLKKRLSGVPCQNCGWGETACDLHRIVPATEGGRYTTDNVVVLCPNCHRLVHWGHLRLGFEALTRRNAN